MSGHIRCAHGRLDNEPCDQCGLHFEYGAASYHQHAYHPAGMRRVPDWQVTTETWEALLVCSCGHMEWRRAPAVA